MLGAWAVPFPFDNITTGGMRNGSPEQVEEGIPLDFLIWKWMLSL